MYAKGLLLDVLMGWRHVGWLSARAVVLLQRVRVQESRERLRVWRTSTSEWAGRRGGRLCMIRVVFAMYVSGGLKSLFCSWSEEVDCMARARQKASKVGRSKGLELLAGCVGGWRHATVDRARVKDILQREAQTVQRTTVKAWISFTLSSCAVQRYADCTWRGRALAVCARAVLLWWETAREGARKHALLCTVTWCSDSGLKSICVRAWLHVMLARVLAKRSQMTAHFELWRDCVSRSIRLRRLSACEGGVVSALGSWMGDLFTDELSPLSGESAWERVTLAVLMQSVTSQARIELASMCSVSFGTPLSEPITGDVRSTDAAILSSIALGDAKSLSLSSRTLRTSDSASPVQQAASPGGFSDARAPSPAKKASLPRVDENPPIQGGGRGKHPVLLLPPRSTMGVSPLLNVPGRTVSGRIPPQSKDRRFTSLSTAEEEFPASTAGGEFTESTPPIVAVKGCSPVDARMRMQEQRERLAHQLRAGRFGDAFEAGQWGHARKSSPRKNQNLEKFEDISRRVRNTEKLDKSPRRTHVKMDCMDRGVAVSVRPSSRSSEKGSLTMHGEVGIVGTMEGRKPMSDAPPPWRTYFH